MSHYKVAVITNGKSINDMLAPYYTNLKMPRHILYTKKQAIEQERIHTNILKNNFLEYEKVRKNMPKDITKEEDIIKYMNEHFINNYMYDYNRDKTLEDFNKTDEELYGNFIKDYDKEAIDEDGNIYVAFNEHGKWDWYSEGGYYDKYLNLKDGSMCNSAPIKDIKFYNKEKEKDYEKFWDLYVIKGIENLTDEEKREIETTHLTKEYYLQRYETKEQYVKEQCTYIADAIIDSNGIWHEPEETGYLGSLLSTAEYERLWSEQILEIINAEDKNNILTIVDCHI